MTNDSPSDSPDDTPSDPPPGQGQGQQNGGWRKWLSGTVVAALITAGAGYYGTQKGADSALQAARENISSQEKLQGADRETKQKDLRVQAGLKYIAATDKANNLLARALGSLNRGELPSTEVLTGIVENTAPMTEAFMQIRAYGGTTATELAYRMTTYTEDVIRRIQAAITESAGTATLPDYAENPSGWARYILLEHGQSLQILRWDYVGDCAIDKGLDCANNVRPETTPGTRTFDKDDPHTIANVRTSLQKALFD